MRSFTSISICLISLLGIHVYIGQRLYKSCSPYTVDVKLLSTLLLPSELRTGNTWPTMYILYVQYTCINVDIFLFEPIFIVCLFVTFLLVNVNTILNSSIWLNIFYQWMNTMSMSIQCTLWGDHTFHILGNVYLF